MKYAPERVFVLESGKYTEITYPFCCRENGKPLEQI